MPDTKNIPHGHNPTPTKVYMGKIIHGREARLFAWDSIRVDFCFDMSKGLCTVGIFPVILDQTPVPASTRAKRFAINLS